MLNNPFTCKPPTKFKRNSAGSPLHESYHISPKPEPVINDIYLVLRPDKDEKANELFPGKRVIYLRYDKEEDLKLINEYKKSQS